MGFICPERIHLKPVSQSPLWFLSFRSMVNNGECTTCDRIIHTIRVCEAMYQRRKSLVIHRQRERDIQAKARSQTPSPIHLCSVWTSRGGKPERICLLRGTAKSLSLSRRPPYETAQTRLNIYLLIQGRPRIHIQSSRHEIHTHLIGLTTTILTLQDNEIELSVFALAHVFQSHE